VFTTGKRYSSTYLGRDKEVTMFVQKCNWLIVMLLVLVCAAMAGLSGLPAQQTIKNPGTIIVARPNGAEILDPAAISDDFSAETGLNMYESLLRFKPGETSEYEPALASVVPTKDNGLITVGVDTEYIDFPIRAGVKFHKGGTLTPEDVKYSFLRSIIADMSGSGVRLFMEALTGYSSIEDVAKNLAGVDDFAEVDAVHLRDAFYVIDDAIQVMGNTVEFRFHKTYAPAMTFFVGKGFFESIVDKSWVIEQGGWPGTADTWIDYHNLPNEEYVLYDKVNGTGPFQLISWDRATGELTMGRFDGYCRGPARIEKVIVKKVLEWTTRKLMLQNGDIDIINNNPPAYLDQLEGEEGIVINTGIRFLLSTGFYLTWNVTGENNPRLGSGKLDGNGIPPDFFSDINIRKAFAYTMDYDACIEEYWQGQTYQPCGPILKGMPGYREDQPCYRYDPDKAEEYFRKAYDGKLWEVGFKLKAGVLAGRPKFKVNLDILQDRLLRLNPKFQMEVEELESGTLLDSYFSGRLPITSLSSMTSRTGVDPHAFITDYMASSGLQAGVAGPSFVSLAKQEFDPLIEEAATALDEAKREELYDQLQRLYYEYVVSIIVFESPTNIAYRDWVNGIDSSLSVVNPVTISFYMLWKD